jgi:hypothetical protein
MRPREKFSIKKSRNFVCPREYDQSRYGDLAWKAGETTELITVSKAATRVPHRSSIFARSNHHHRAFALRYPAVFANDASMVLAEGIAVRWTLYRAYDEESP